MRVLLDVSAVPAQPVGAGVYVINLAGALVRAGDAEVHLLTRHGDAGRWGAIAPGAAVHPLVPDARPLRLAWEQLRGPAVVRDTGADVWHGPHYTLPLGVPARRVVTVHDMTFFDHPQWHERSKVLFFRRMTRAAVHRADAVVAVSETTAARVRDLLAPRAPVLVAPHGVDHDRFSPPPRPGRPEGADAAVLDAAGVAPPFLAFVGTLEPRKNVPGLVAAFAAVAAGHPDLRLVIAGHEGWGAAEVSDAVARSRVAHRVLRLGYAPAELVPALYRHAAAVVYPSFAEGFGLPALEALACGAPLVTTTGTAMAEVAGEAAVLVPPGDVDRLAASIERVLTDQSLAARLRGAGPQVAARYTWEACARAHVEAYEAAGARC